MIWGKRILPFGVISIALAALLLPGRVSLRAVAHQPPAAGGTAEQTTGAPGSPTATTTINGEQLPPPPQKFEGVINRNAAQSKPFWPARVVPPKGAPNVLLIMTDDTGFGVSSTFGGVIPTPNLDRIAANGLRYTNMNSTALCSPSRAALVTGRNHHSMGVRGRRRAVDRLSRLQQHHDPGQGNDWKDPQGSRLLDVLVRQGPQHSGIPGEPSRALRPVADRYGL